MTNSTERQQLINLVKSMDSKNIDKVKIFISGLEAGIKASSPDPDHQTKYSLSLYSEFSDKRLC